MLLNYTLYTSVNGIADVVDKIRQFATAHGWTTATYETGYVYHPNGSVIEPVADAHGAYLCLTSPGQGSTQNLVVKMEVSNYMTYGTSKTYHGTVSGLTICSSYVADSDDYRLCINMASSSSSIRSGTFYTIPSMQYGLTEGEVLAPTDSNAEGYYGKGQFGCSLPHTTTIPKLWLFGNDHWICGVAQLDDHMCTLFHFGSFEMFDTAPTQGDCCGTLAVGSAEKCDGTAQAVTWWGYYADYTPPFFSAPFGFLSVGLGSAGGHHRYEPVLRMYWDSQRSVDIGYGSGDDEPSQHVGNSLNLLYLCESGRSVYSYNYYGYSPWKDYLVYKEILLNTSNSRQPMAKCIYTWPRQSDGAVQPVCQTPCYFLRNDNFNFAQVLTYDSASYMVFPLITRQNDYAVAFRIV